MRTAAPARTYGHRLAPTTDAGSAAVWSSAACLVSWLVVVAVVVLAPTYTHGVWNAIILTAVMVGILSAFAAPICAIVALIKGERALSVYLGFAPIVCSLLFDFVLNPLFGWLK